MKKYHKNNNIAVKGLSVDIGNSRYGTAFYRAYEKKTTKEPYQSLRIII